MKATLSLSTLLISIILFLSSCSKKISNNLGTSFSGTIETAGMTSYQYGSHTLKNNNTYYALRSSSLDLNKFLGKSVTIDATKVEGYPLEGGPEFLDVHSVLVKEQ